MLKTSYNLGMCFVIILVRGVVSYCSFRWAFMLRLLSHFTPLVNTFSLDHLPSTLREETCRINELQPRNKFKYLTLLCLPIPLPHKCLSSLFPVAGLQILMYTPITKEFSLKVSSLPLLEG